MSERIYGAANCPNCGFPVVGTRCPYCRTRFPEWTQDDCCPQCGADIDSDTLTGYRIALTLRYCRRCNWSDTRRSGENY